MASISSRDKKVVLGLLILFNLLEINSSRFEAVGNPHPANLAIHPTPYPTPSREKIYLRLKEILSRQLHFSYPPISLSAPSIICLISLSKAF
jgi:hypothetical protein